MTATNFLSAQQVVSTPSPSASPSAEASIDTAALVQLIKSKRESGFQILYDKYCGALYGILLKIVRRTDVADDLLQDTFVKIWKHIDSFDPAKGTLFTWMLNIARNQAIDYLRSSDYRHQLSNVDIDLLSLQLDHRSATTSNFNETEFSDFIKKVLHLDSKYAVVIDMIFFYGWTYEQTAQRLNLPLGTVKTRARKGLSMLKIIYQQEKTNG